MLYQQRWLISLAAGLSAVLLLGCPDKKPQYPACEGDKDCKDGQHCVNKVCVECGEDSHCPEGQECVSGACKIVEGACTADDQCAEGEVCKDGRCSACAADNECGPGGKCTSGVCERPKACTVDEDCADDEDCVDGRCQQPWKNGEPAEVSCDFQTIYFEFDKAAILPEYRDTLDKLAECVQKAPADRSLSLYGHTDESGTEEYNIGLSERRARAVADYLARLGVDPARFYIVPKGESELSGRGPEGDRRVEMEWR